MEKSKISSHGYTTRRNKIPKLEENNENPAKNSSVLSKTKNAESPSAAKFCMISGYASPPCRLVTLSQQNENEIVWDLTSPSARKYQVMVSDKKTSTPNSNQTPTRSKRELRPRVALCKKNIAMTEEDKSGELVNELAFLNDMVNTQKAHIIMTPPQSVKGQSTDDCESPDEKTRPVEPMNLNTSDAFDDDSFFSESILLSTQALEEEAIGCNPTPVKNKLTKDLNVSLMSPSSTNKSFSLAQQSELAVVEGNVSRKSFDLDDEDPAPLPSVLKENVMIIESPIFSIPKLPVKKDEKAIPSCPRVHLHSEPKPISANQFPLPKTAKSGSIFNPPAKTTVPKSQWNNHDSQPFSKVGSAKLREPIPLDSRHQKNANHDNSRPRESCPARPVSELCGGIGIKRIADKPIDVVPQTMTCRKLSPPNRSNAQSIDPFDDEDDDLLCAIAEEIESQYVSVPAANGSKLKEDDDDGFFQPEVLAYISQIETRITATQKSTADLLEEKKQAAIQRRKERLMSRR